MASVELDEASPQEGVLVLRSGVRWRVPFAPEPTKEDVLERLEKRRASTELALRHNYMVCVGGGISRRSFYREVALEIVTILVSEVPVEEKVTKLKELGELSARDETWWRNLLRHLPSPELSNHYDRVRRRELAIRRAQAFEEARARLPAGVDVTMQWAVFWSLVGTSR